MRRLLLAVVAAGLIASAPEPAARAARTTATSAKPIPVEAFAALPFIYDPVLSPEGDRIAARASVDGRSAIAVWTLPTQPDSKPRLLAAGSGTYHWAGNDRLIVVQGFSLNLFGVPIHASTLISYEVMTGRKTEIGSSVSLLGDGLLFVDPAGRHILRTKQKEAFSTPSVVRVDLASGQETEVQPPVRNVFAWHVDGRGVVRAGLEIRGRRSALLYRRTATEPLRKIETRNPAFADGSVLDAVRFIDNTDSGYVVSNARTGRFGVYRFDFARNQYGAGIWEHPEVDALSVIPGDDGELDGVRYNDEHARVHWLDPEAAKVQQSLDRSLPGKVNLISGGSRDRSKLLVWSGAADDPGTYYVFDRKARRLQLFASPYDQLLGKTLAPVKAVRYPSRDGLTIRAYLTLPAVPSSPKGLPLIVMPHGGPFARDLGEFDAIAQFLTSRGYAVLQPNFRGSTGFGRDFVERGYGQWGAGMIDDMDAGVDWLAAQGTIDPKRVCMLGTSYGGYAALWAATRDPARYRCAVSMAGISDLRAMLKYDNKVMIARRYANDWSDRVHGAEKQDLKAISPLQQVDRLVVPVLIAHGERDTNVPPSQSRQLVAALAKRGKPVESVFYPKSGHGFDTVADSVDFMKRVEAFLARHNPA